MRKPESVIFMNMCMVRDASGNVLVEDRVDPDWPGITFPGGHVERGEPFTDAVIREMREETGLTVSCLQLCGVKDWMEDESTRRVILCYKTDCYEGQLHSSEEGEVYWVPLRELPNRKLARNMTLMLRLFTEDTVSEHLLYEENGQWLNVLK